MEFGSVASVGSFALAGLIALAGVFRFIQTQVESLRREIGAAKDTAQLMAEKAAESEAKQRHTANNALQVITTRMELDIRSLQKESVRHEQMDALESRIKMALDKIDTKLEKFAEVATNMGAIQQQLTQMFARMERISDRLDESSGVLKNTRA